MTPWALLSQFKKLFNRLDCGHFYHLSFNSFRSLFTKRSNLLSDCGYNTWFSAQKKTPWFLFLILFKNEPQKTTNNQKPISFHQLQSSVLILPSQSILDPKKDTQSQVGDVANPSSKNARRKPLFFMMKTRIQHTEAPRSKFGSTDAYVNRQMGSDHDLGIEPISGRTHKTGLSLAPKSFKQNLTI